MANYFDQFWAFTVQMFILVDPIVAIPIFLAITPNNSREERRAMARRGCSVACLVVIFFILIGPAILGYFGIQTPAVQICGGVLLFAIALEMLYGRATKTVSSPRETHLAEAKEDISITPLAIPLLAGPGSIATSLIFAKKTHDPWAYLALVAGAAAIFGLTYVLLLRAHHIVRFLGDLGVTIVTRIMGLVLAFISAQYVVDGISTVFGR